MKDWTIGALAAIGIGLGTAFAASMGPAGYALGLAIAMLLVGTRRLARRSR